MNRGKFGIYGALLVLVSVLALMPATSAGDGGSTICVVKFYDNNSDGVFNVSQGDYLLANWTVFVRGITPSTGFIKHTSLTDEDGTDCFEDLPIGTYYAGEEKVPIGWKATTKPFYTVKVNDSETQFVYIGDKLAYPIRRLP